MPSACGEGFLDADNRPSICLLAGVIVGGFGAIIGGWVGFLSSGHQLNDPIFLALSISSILKGLLYFNWTAFLTPLVFSIMLGLAAGVTAKILAVRAGRRLFSDESGRSATVAALLSAAPVWIKEVSGFQVLIMYALATWLSMIFARSIAKRITHK
ncbi:MAG: hypothetical protein IH859_01850 [Chloroflexi bacterium]|nr:hypothetical protein [Chloroflexota bacterium]